MAQNVCFLLLKWLSFAVFEDNLVPCVVAGMCGAAQARRQQRPALVWGSLQQRAHLGPHEASTASNLESC